MEIPLLTLGETFMKPSTMLYRNLLAMEAEEALRSYPVDGVVLMGGCDKTVPGAGDGRDEREPAGDLRPRRTDAARQLARPDPRLGQRRLEVLDRAARRQPRRVLLARDGRRHRALARHLHDDGHGVDDGGGRRCAGPDAARRLVDSRRRFRALRAWPPPPAAASSRWCGRT